MQSVCDVRWPGCVFSTDAQLWWDPHTFLVMVRWWWGWPIPKCVPQDQRQVPIDTLFSSHSDLTILIIFTPLVSSKIPARFLTSELWTSVPQTWPWPGRSSIMMGHLFPTPTRYMWLGGLILSIKLSIRLRLSSMDSARAPYTASQYVLSWVTSRAHQASSKYILVSSLPGILSGLLFCVVVVNSVTRETWEKKQLTSGYTAR